MPTAPRAPKAAKVAKPRKPAAARGGALVVVESPAKAKTIKKYLGRLYDVRACVDQMQAFYDDLLAPGER